MTALIVIDTPALRQRIRNELQDCGLQVTMAGTVLAAEAAIGSGRFLVVIVDVVLPDGSGLDVIDALRASGSKAHVIALTDSRSELDHLEIMRRGADDIVVKPFYVRVLAERVLAVRRRADPEHRTVVEIGRWNVDLRSRLVTCAGQLVDLTAKEFDLLAYLAVRPGHVFGRDQLLHAVWHSAPEWQTSATVTEHMRRLRGKIEENPNQPTILVTVRGAGYRLDLPADSVDVALKAVQPIAVGVIVHVEGRIVFADQAATELLASTGVPTLVGRDILELVASSSKAAATQRLADGQTGRQRRSEIMQFQRSDGEELTVEVTSTFADWHGTRARRVELTRADVPTLLRRLVIGSLADVTEAVVIIDLHSHIRSWNPSAERIYGWPEEAVLGRHVLDILYLVDDADEGGRAWEHLERTGRWNGTVVHATRDGSTVKVIGSATVLRDEHGEPIGVVSVNRPAELAGSAPVPDLNAALVARIRQGIADDEFVVHYQPIVDLGDGSITTLEALARWDHPDRGVLLPAEFLDAAERSGSIVELGDVVLEKACRQGAEWERAGADIRLSVNVSTRQLASPGLADRFKDILSRTGFSPAHLWIEVTETAVVEELEHASAILRELAELGVRVSIDDFGTGWASLTYLQTFPVQALKIDGSFVATIGQDFTSAAIVRSVLSLGAELGIVVVAEGIETPEQRDLLKAMGCTLGQGYLFARPAPADEVPIERARRVSGVPAGQAAVGGHRAHPVKVIAGGVAPAMVAQAGRSATALLERQLVCEAKSTSQLEAQMTSPAAAARIGSDTATLLRGLLRISSVHGPADLRDATERFDSVVEAMIDPLMLMMPVRDETGAIVDFECDYVNAAQAEYLGITAAEMVGRRLLATSPGSTTFDLYREVAETGVAMRTEVHRIGPFNGVEDVEFTFDAAIVPCGAGLVVCARDISERKAVEAALGRSEERFRSLIENSFDVVAIVGLDGTIGYVSPAVKRMLGYEPDALIGSRFMEIVLAEDREIAVEALRATATSPGMAGPTRVRVLTAMGETIWVEAVSNDSRTDPAVAGIVVNIRDVTEQVAAFSKLAVAEGRFEDMFEQVGIGAVLADLNGVMTRVNGAACRLLGRPAEQLIGHRSTEFLHPDDASMFDALQTRVAAGHDNYFDEGRRFLRPDGTVVWASVSVTLVRDQAGEPEFMSAQLKDITDRKTAEADLVHQALHDPLTGLANRALLTDHLVHGLAMAGRTNTTVGVMFLDVDNFKVVNDSLGHNVGDELLKRAAQRIAETIRPGDTLGRFGGDEFVVVSNDVSIFQLGLIAARVLEALAQPYELTDRNVLVTATASAGVVVGGPEATPDGLLRDADTAMYRAKAHGRGRVEVFDDEMRSGAELRLATTSALRLASTREEFTVRYQPVIDLASGELVSAEALVRWEHPQGHIVSPDQFIPLAEETGLIIPIGSWVLEQACYQVVQWRRTNPSITVAVNLSVCQVVAPGAAKLVEDILRRTGAPGEALHLELTESVFLENNAEVENVLVDLKALGVRLSIDDFGTGYSSLNRLRNFPFDAVKIDRAFVHGLGSNAHDSALVATILAMANALDLEVTAEGVETQDQLDHLKRLHCPRAQGFYLAKPTTAAAIGNLITEGQRGPSD